MWEDDLFQILYIARNSAYRLRKHPRSYNELEAKVVDIYHHESNNLKRSHFAEWVLNEVGQLPEIEIVPVVPLDFKLEDFIIHKYFRQA